MDDKDRFFQINGNLKIDERDMFDFRNSVLVKKVEAGTTLLGPGDDCLYLPVVLDGDLKVHRSAENGREIVLYHLNSGESCILSALGILNRTAFPASAVSSTGGTILFIPDRLVRFYLDKYPNWRKYIFALYNDRFHVVLELIDEILFRKIDVRLARFLLARSNNGETVRNFTHQSLAEELGSSREVISRVLKNLSERGILSYHRSEIEILDRKKLEKISDL